MLPKTSDSDFLRKKPKSIMLTVQSTQSLNGIKGRNLYGDIIKEKGIK